MPFLCLNPGRNRAGLLIHCFLHRGRTCHAGSPGGPGRYHALSGYRDNRSPWTECGAQGRTRCGRRAHTPSGQAPMPGEGHARHSGRRPTHGVEKAARSKPRNICTVWICPRARSYRPGPPAAEGPWSRERQQQLPRLFSYIPPFFVLMPVKTPGAGVLFTRKVT
jgi:hypothetical protein